MEKYFKERSACHQEISVKFTNSCVHTHRANFGFEANRMWSLKDFLVERIGQDRYNRVARHFRREIEEPREGEYMMLGFDGSDYEVYTEYDLFIRSYDTGKDTLFVYNPCDPENFSDVYNYLREVLPTEIYDMLTRVLPVHKCGTLYSKQSPFHRCVYLFRPKMFPQVKFVKELLYKAARAVNREHVPLEDSMYLSYISIAITPDSRPELAYYFRRTRLEQEEIQPGPRSSDALGGR